MLINNIVRQCAVVTVGFMFAANVNIPATFAQSPSERSLYQAGYNAGQRLQQEGFSLNTLEGAPYYETFLESEEIITVGVDIPSTGNYILLVGGDDDTVDLDVYFPQINASDVTFGNTAFIDFQVLRPGEFSYEIDMLDCRTVNCGVYAVLLKVGY